MKRIILILSIFLNYNIPAHSQADNPIHLKGKVSDNKGDLIPYVNILVLNKKSGIAADFTGHFSILVDKKDTLLFTAIGYKSAQHIIPDTIKSGKYTLSVILETDTILLKRTIVYPWPATVKQLKKEYLALDLPDEKIDFRLPKHYGYVNTNSEGFVAMTMQGPVSFFYDKFSHEAKMRRLYESLLKKDREDKYIASRISKSLIERITGLQDTEEIEAFLEFCDLSYEFITVSSDYEIFLSVKECFTRYKKMQK